MAAPATGSGRRSGAVAAPVTLAALVTAALAVWFRAGWGGPEVIRAADDLACGIAAAAGAFGAWRTAGRVDAGYRRSWRLLGAGAAAWSLGDVAWTTQDLLGRHPAESAVGANVAFLLLPVLACLGVLSLPRDGIGTRRRQWLLDGAIFACSTAFTVWTLALQNLRGIQVSHVGLLIDAAFPVADLVLLTTLVLAAAWAPVGQRRMWLLVVALVLLTVADSSFAYLTATGHYRSGSWCDVAFIGAFTMLAATAAAPEGTLTQRRRGTALPLHARLALPYLPIVGAVTVGIYRLATGGSLDGTALVLWGLVAGLVVIRQYLALLANRRLVDDLRCERERLRASALTDPLTGIGNRAMFVDRVQHALHLHARTGHPVALCWIDADDFKVVNDTHGHAVGDRLLTILSRRLAAALRAGDTIARLGGDEFGVLIEDGGDPRAVARRLLAASEAPMDVAGTPLRLPVSVGVALLTPADPTIDAEELMSRADIAMYAAKAQHCEHIAVFRPGMTVPGAEDATLRDPLRAAIAAGTIEVHYQPVVVADTGRLRGFEALARWQLDGTPIAPNRFIPLAERLGLAGALGAQVLRTALAQLADWSRDRGDDDLVMSVNLSADQVSDPGLPHLVGRLLDEYRVQPRQLVLEITEGALLTDDPNALATARALADLGVALALDDFGTGYSSLAHLRRFPLTVLKIDRAFVADIDNDDQARCFLRAIARLGRDLGLRLVAEGVERRTQLDLVRELGPTLVQGYLFSPPKPAPELAAVVAPAEAAPWARAPRPLGTPRPAIEARSV